MCTSIEILSPTGRFERRGSSCLGDSYWSLEITEITLNILGEERTRESKLGEDGSDVEDTSNFIMSTGFTVEGRPPPEAVESELELGDL